MFDSIKELAQRFTSERPPTDPDRRRDRVDEDGFREMFARAESAVMVGPPIDASMEPVTAPENVQLRTRGGKTSIPQANDMAVANLDREGVSRGLEAGANALVKEAGWSRSDAQRLKVEVERGEMTEQQFKRVVENELERSETSGRIVQPPANPGPKGVDQRRSSGRFVSEDRTDAGVGRNPDSGQFKNVEKMARGEGMSFDDWGDEK